MKFFLLGIIAVMCFTGLGIADDYDARQERKEADERAYENRKQRNGDNTTVFDRQQPAETR